MYKVVQYTDSETIITKCSTYVEAYKLFKSIPNNVEILHRCKVLDTK